MTSYPPISRTDRHPGPKFVAILSRYFGTGTSLNPASRHGQARDPTSCLRLPAALRLPASTLPADLAGKLGEELVGKLARRAIDEPLADLGELAADLGLDVVAQERAAVLGLQLHGGAALGEARDA